MSNAWQPYVDDQLIGTKHCSKGLICGLDGGVWAISKGFAPVGKELQNICNAFNDPSGIVSSGLFLEGKKYFTLRTDNQSVYGKLGQGGCCCCKTNGCVVIGVYSEGTQPGQCNQVVERLAQWLRDQGY